MRATIPCTPQEASRLSGTCARSRTAGVAGAIIGMALYTGVLDARLIAEEFAEEFVE